MPILRNFATLALLLFSAPGLFATILTPGSTGAPSVFDPTGLSQISPTVTGSISPGTFAADYQTAVYTDTNNIFCAGCYDFVYNITNNGPNGIDRAVMFNFGNFLTNVGYFVIPGGVTPISVDRSTNGSNVSFFYGSSATTMFTSGTQSQTLVIQTNALNYTGGNLTIQDGTFGTGAAYQPSVARTAAPTPEPGTMLLLGAGLIGLGLITKLRKRGEVKTTDRTCET